MTWRTLRLSSTSCGHACVCAKSCSCSALSILDLPQRPLSEASAAALPAFVGSRNSTELALHLLGADPVDPGDSDYLPSGEESQAREQLCLILPDLLHSASQRSIQRVLDSLSFTSLKASLCLRDQARLNTIASPYAGAWLRALPNLFLASPCPSRSSAWLSGCGLASSSSLPPQSLRCPCGKVIDPQGDHPLGCGLGPFRIKRHDSLRDIIWQALLVDNPRATQEQHCGVNNSRPGDIFHPDFVQGKPAYFDVSVRNSLQPQFLCRAASLAGAAGEVGEMAKDARHEEGSHRGRGSLLPISDGDAVPVDDP